MSLVLPVSGEELREKFFALRTPKEVASLLDIEYGRLIYYMNQSQKSPNPKSLTAQS
jgi:hypothetical protein